MMNEQEEATTVEHLGQSEVPRRLGVKPISRRGFMALAGGSIASASLLAGCGEGDTANGAGDDTSEFGAGDIGVLNFMLMMEHIEGAFYDAIASSNRFHKEEREALAKFGEQEKGHATALIKGIKGLGSKPAPKPQTKFPLTTDSGTLELASTLENVGAAAYLGQLPRLQKEPLRSLFISIHSVEGRHAAAINYLLKKPITPDGAFAKPASVEDVLNTVKPYLVE
jgi:hypothetical protein